MLFIDKNVVPVKNWVQKDIDLTEVLSKVVSADAPTEDTMPLNIACSLRSEYTNLVLINRVVGETVRDVCYKTFNTFDINPEVEEFDLDHFQLAVAYLIVSMCDAERIKSKDTAFSEIMLHTHFQPIGILSNGTSAFLYAHIILEDDYVDAFKEFLSEPNQRLIPISEFDKKGNMVAFAETIYNI